MDESQELFLHAPAAAVGELWMTVQAAIATPAFKGFESEIAGRIATWQVLPSDFLPLSICEAWCGNLATFG